MSIKVRLLAFGVVGALSSAATLIYPWEDERQDVYPDIVGIPTVCIGHTGPDVTLLGKRRTPEECAKLFSADLKEAEAGVLQCTPKVTGGPRAAFTSLAFNIGTKAYCKSTLAQKANQGDFKGACNQLTRWVYAGGKVSQGLLNRRLAEQKVCFEGPL